MAIFVSFLLCLYSFIYWYTVRSFFKDESCREMFNSLSVLGKIFFACFVFTVMSFLLIFSFLVAAPYLIGVSIFEKMNIVEANFLWRQRNSNGFMEDYANNDNFVRGLGDVLPEADTSNKIGNREIFFGLDLERGK